MMATKAICKIDGCSKKVHGGGLCNTHYTRKRLHGDPLKSGPPRAAAGEARRFIDAVVLAHEGDGCLQWPFATGGGYAQIRINGKASPAYRLVCELAHGAPPSPEYEATHNCGRGNRGCVHPGHLEWKTHKENMADKILHGTHIRGERCGTSKLTESQAREVLRLKGSKPQREIAAEFGISRAAVGYIHRGARWAWLEPSP
ncbi:hypothetical protein CN177_13530 [Sinorhizobium meliloti]|nr:hypothetical protein CN219_03595 [Sinorhizobium meliloti]RVI39053.1 hypothetical protein CN197_02640 [Sinorhizobium meliloti]RVI46688.1 hypothetical protein CN196_09490 [Sinorhizobium meliloti]RVJ25690.1 hypothetical protein CN177_13530 [Sinorhizobium meliloti]RVK02231.1 hypothetical protein CN170_08600 [Sinorhizobium meliloti]